MLKMAKDAIRYLNNAIVFANQLIYDDFHDCDSNVQAVDC